MFSSIYFAPLNDFIDEFGTLHQNWGVHIFAVGEWMGGQLDE